MYRGTTPTFTFKVNTDIDLNEIAECWITFKSKLGNKEKTFVLSDIIVDPVEKTLTVALSQDETLYFNTGSLEVQIRLRTNNDLAYASDIKEVLTKRILKDGEI